MYLLYMLLPVFVECPLWIFEMAFIFALIPIFCEIFAIVTLDATTDEACEDPRSSQDCEDQVVALSVARSAFGIAVQVLVVISLCHFLQHKFKNHTHDTLNDTVEESDQEEEEEATTEEQTP